MTRGFALRYKMLHFLQNLQHFFMYEVIEPQYLVMEQCMKQAETVEALQEMHHTFVSNVMKSCMLTDLNLMKVCLFLNMVIEYHSFSVLGI